ncbi:hypothetical protein BRD00_03030 [Halobacteriales archaeon QS_8_69_26]|nr:MAG: hypothetical protein BRD00_03030 [Halobacteriales archaeon QS_8_69_26]
MTGLPSDHPSVTTVPARLDADATGRVRVVVERDPEFPTGSDGTGVGADVVRVVLDGTDRYARPRRERAGDGVVVPGVYDAPDAARNPGDATDRLGEWVASNDPGAGDPVLVDVLDPGARYGLRVPGQRVVYDDRQAVDDSLASIARDLDDG